MSGHVQSAVLRLLLLKSGGRCAFSPCGLSLVQDNPDGSQTTIGEAAHIKGEKPGSARYDPEFPSNQVSAEPNLILLCANHHTQVDKADSAWSVEALTSMKRDHEQGVRSALDDAMTKIDFSELEAVVNGLLAKSASPATDMSLTMPQEKMAKNNLSDVTGHYLVLGLSKAKAVQAFVQERESLEPGFGKRLSAGFLSRYHAAIAKGLAGDAVYVDLVEFSGGVNKTTIARATGLAVQAYLFTSCEVFEK